MFKFIHNLSTVCFGGSFHVGGGLLAKFRVGAAHSFKMEPLARPVFVKIIPLARLISTSKVLQVP